MREPKKNRSVSPSFILSDTELMQRLKQEDHDALTILFERYHLLVLSVARKILRDSCEAEDTMQDVFFEIYQKADLFNPSKGSAKTWILQYAYHRSLNRRRYLSLRHSENLEYLSELERLESPHFQNGTSNLSYNELALTVRQGLATLKPNQRETLELTLFDGLLLSEIAERNQEPLGNVRNHYYRGLKQLRDFLHNGSGKSFIKKDTN